MKRTITLSIFLFLFLAPLTAQPPVWWVQRYNGPPDQADESHSIAIDAAGNSYITGSSFNNNGNLDILTIKYGPSGQQMWAAFFDGANDNDEGREVVVDNSGNVYVTGYTKATNGQDVVTIKYNSTGVQQWAQSYDGAAHAYDEGLAIGLDAAGNVYTAGISTESGFDYDGITIKYDNAGVQQLSLIHI